VVVLWSKKSVASRWVRAEATQADRNGTLVPAMIEDCKRPIMFELKQTADLSKWSGDVNDREWQAYLASVRRLVEKGEHAAGSSPSRPARQEHKGRISPALIAFGIAVLLGVAGAWMLHRARTPAAVAQVAVPSAATPAGAKAPVSIAVLPFVNMSSDPEQEYFSDGLSEELLNQLAQVPDLRVIGRTSSFAFKGKNEDLRHIGEVLGVNHLLEGSVRKAGNRVLITAQLIRQSDGSHIWSETYERSLDDIFSIQEEIARTVAGQLRLKLGTQNVNASGTTNVVAFDEFLAGRALLNSNDPASMVLAVPHLEHAVSLDPQYVSAWLWLVDAYTRLSLGHPAVRQQTLRKQEEAIDRLVMLTPGTPEASLALSYRAAAKGELWELQRLLKESLGIAGGSGIRARLRYGQFLACVASIGPAIEQLERVRRDDPLDVFARTNLMLTYELAGQSDRADAEMAQLLQLPGGRTPALLGSAITRAQGRRDPVALATALAQMPDTGEGPLGMNVLLQPLLQNPPAARKELRRLLDDPAYRENIYGASGIVQWAAYFGDKALSLQALESMRQQDFGFETWGWIIWRPVLRDLRPDPGFKKLLAEMGLVDYWRKAGNWGDFCKPVGKDDFECK
jgi:TolB-like protein